MPAVPLAIARQQNCGPEQLVSFRPFDSFKQCISLSAESEPSRSVKLNSARSLESMLKAGSIFKILSR